MLVVLFVIILNGGLFIVFAFEIVFFTKKIYSFIIYRFILINHLSFLTLQ